MCGCENIKHQLDEVVASEISLDEVNANLERFGLGKRGTIAKLKSIRSAKIIKLTEELRACKVKALKNAVEKAETIEDMKESFIRLLDII